MKINLSSFLQWRINIFICKIIGWRITFFYICFLSKLYFFFNNSERWKIIIAVKSVFKHRKNNDEIASITANVFRGISLHYYEKFFNVYSTADTLRSFAETHMESEGLNSIDQALARGKGVLLITGHFGGVELIPSFFAANNYPATIVARFSTNHLRKISFQQASNFSTHIIDADRTSNIIKAIFENLKENRIVITQCDEIDEWKPSRHDTTHFLGKRICMEESLRPYRREVPDKIIHLDLKNLLHRINAHTLLVSDALFKSFDIFPLLRELGLKVNFETRCDILDPSIISKVADIGGALALGFESASYNTLKRMNKVKNRSHYEHYISNTQDIFKEAVRNEIPLMVFMIAGYPGDTRKDLAESLEFAEMLSKNSGPGGHVFKIGECRVYPKTKLYDLAVSLPNVVFDNDGVFGQNIVRRPSQDLDFETVLEYINHIFNLSNFTPKLYNTLLNIMPFFRLPLQALRDDIIPDPCFMDKERNILNVHEAGLSKFRKWVPELVKKHKMLMSGQRSTRDLPL